MAQGINSLGEVVPLAELLSERSRVTFQQQADCGRPGRRTCGCSEGGRVDRLDTLAWNYKGVASSQPGHTEFIKYAL